MQPTNDTVDQPLPPLSEVEAAAVVTLCRRYAFALPADVPAELVQALDSFLHQAVSGQKMVDAAQAEKARSEREAVRESRRQQVEHGGPLCLTVSAGRFDVAGPVFAVGELIGAFRDDIRRALAAPAPTDALSSFLHDAAEDEANEPHEDDEEGATVHPFSRRTGDQIESRGDE